MSAKHGLLAPQFDTLEQQREAATLGMWVFLVTELLFFGVLFTGYTVYRVRYAHDFEVASDHLNVLIGSINTVVLLTSSLTMALAVYATQAGHRRMQLGCLLATVLLALTFMVLKAREYYTDVEENLVPGTAYWRPEEWVERGANPEHVALFFSTYYIMTGLHAIHVTAGIAVLLWLVVLAWRGRLPPEYYTPVEVTGLYWHFVDVVWIFLLPLLYLIGTHALEDLHF